LLKKINFYGRYSYNILNIPAKTNSKIPTVYMVALKKRQKMMIEII